MSLSKRQKVLAGVFLVGLVGLVADRTLLRPQGGPQTASAESSAPDVAARSGGTPAGEKPPARAPLAERLKNLVPDEGDGPVELRDPFALPASWSDSGVTGKERGLDAAGTFARRHQLKAVVVQGQDVCAQVDDNVLIPGQVLDGFVLVSVDDRSATFEREGRQVVLDLAVK